MSRAIAACCLLGFALSASAAAADAPLELRNDRTVIRFAETPRGFDLVELACLRPARTFVREGAAGGPLWRITLRKPDYSSKGEVTLDSTVASRLSSSLRSGDGRDELSLHWSGIALPEEPDALDVTVTVALPAGDGLSAWRIAVANRSQALGVWTVDFPMLPNLTVGARGELALPLAWGVIKTDPVVSGDYSADYPSLFATMQLCALTDGGATLYVTPEDPDGYAKQVNWKANPQAGTIEYRLRSFPEDMGKPGKGYSSPYPTVIGFLQGDWLDAAKRYRQWVLASAPWAPKEPLARSTDSPQWIRENPLWLQSNGTGSTAPTDSLLGSIQLKRALEDTPLALQTYWWQKGWPGQTQFDEGYPDTFFELGRGDAERQALREVQAAGVRVIPYTNPNLVDARTGYWKDGGWRWATLPAEEAARHTEWINDVNQLAQAGEVINVQMCPYAKQRQDIVVEWCHKIVGDFGFDGVYLDQVGCLGPALCFDPSHGHPLGGGKHWVEGYRQMLARVRDAIRKLNPDAVLSTECAAEPYGVFDAYLRCNDAQQWMSPIWSAVYGGITISYGSYLYEEDTLGGIPYAAKLAQLFTFGGQLGWVGAGAQVEPRPAWLDYLQELVRARRAASRWIGMGEYLRPPKVRGAETVAGGWRLFGNSRDVTGPAVLSGAFRAADGTVALAFTNYSARAQTITWSAALRDYGITGQVAGVKALYPAEVTPPAKAVRGRLSGTLDLPPATARVLLVEPDAHASGGLPKGE